MLSYQKIRMGKFSHGFFRPPGGPPVYRQELFKKWCLGQTGDGGCEGWIWKLVRDGSHIWCWLKKTERKLGFFVFFFGGGVTFLTDRTMVNDYQTTILRDCFWNFSSTSKQANARKWYQLLWSSPSRYVVFGGITWRIIPGLGYVVRITPIFKLLTTASTWDDPPSIRWFWRYTNPHCFCWSGGNFWVAL